FSSPFPSSHPHRHLHSFPTRRSSDLYAKYTGRLGVCLATSGPGAIHLLNGLYDAKMDGAPVVAITGQTYHDLIGTRYQQEVDLRSEEHTSELQSPYDLVCRLLLEKKK